MDGVPPQSRSFMYLQIVVMYLQMLVSIRPWRVGKSLIPIFPGCHIQPLPRNITMAKMCQTNVSSLSFVIRAYGYIDISMSHAKNWKRLVQYIIISQCLYTCFCFDHTLQVNQILSYLNPRLGHELNSPSGHKLVHLMAFQ